MEQQKLQADYSERIDELLGETVRHLALREAEATTVISGKTVRSHVEGARVKEVLEYDKEQTKALDKALTQASRRTAAEWASAQSPEPRPNLRKTRKLWRFARRWFSLSFLSP